MSNKKKTEQLGMSHGTATHRLRKHIMFKFVQMQGCDICFQCGEKIESVDHLSVEHKIPWLDSDDPVGLFFDLSNIAFSHLSCNVGAARYRDCPERHRKSGEKRRRKTTEGMLFCGCCKQELSEDNFGKRKSRWNGLDYDCKECRKEARR